MARNSDGALVLFSGGQDSATCLAWALSRFDRVETVGFDYGQRHRIELEVRGEFRERHYRQFPRMGRAAWRRSYAGRRHYRPARIASAMTARHRHRDG